MKRAICVLLVCIMYLSIMANAFCESTDMWSKYWQTPAVPDPQRSLSEYEKVDYKTVLRSTNSYLEVPLRFKGEVWGFDQYDENAIFGVLVNRNNSDVLLCFAEGFSNWKWDDGEDIERLLPGDRVTVYGYLYSSLETEMDEYPCVPLFRIATMTLHE